MKKQVIAGILREKTGETIQKFADDLDVSRQCVYQSIGGGGSRRVRIQIALKMQMSPSIIWHENNPAKRLVDDFQFLEAQR